MITLVEMLKEYHSEIIQYVYLGYARWDELIKRIEKQEQMTTSDFYDEQIWTFLLSCGYAAAGEQGLSLLTKTLTGSDQLQLRNPKIWLEVLPIPPRKMEGETHLDLALGAIAVRKGTESGIELDNVESPWICFCEMKWYSDISTSVTYDTHRNQLARVIENALCLQAAGKFAERVHVTLVTPAVFRLSTSKSRLYQYKYEEYNAQRSSLLNDLQKCGLERNDQPGWSYPADLGQRVKDLVLRWATFDELFENLPSSMVAPGIKNFWNKQGNYQGRGSDTKDQGFKGNQRG